MTQPSTPECPFYTQAPSSSLTCREPGSNRADVEIDLGGVYRIHSFQMSRDILRTEGLRQAGFMAELTQQVSALKHQPVLYAEGEDHEMRRDTARYFTPSSVTQYQPMIAKLADTLTDELLGKGELDLDDLSLTLAVQVAARVVGLTHSALPGLEKRVMAFVGRRRQ